MKATAISFEELWILYSARIRGMMIRGQRVEDVQLTLHGTLGAMIEVFFKVPPVDSDLDLYERVVQDTEIDTAYARSGWFTWDKLIAVMAGEIQPEWMLSDEFPASVNRIA